MSAGHSSNQPSRPTSEKDADPRASSKNDSSKNESQQLLDEVLQATLQLAKSDEPLRSEEMRKLVAVARRRKSEPLSVETIAELVETVLRMRFRRVIESSALWDRMTQQIATTIFEDPRTKEGILQFWVRLCEAAS